MDTVLAVMLGIGLAAAAGFRVFVPLLGTSLAAREGHIEVVAGFAWIEHPVVTLVLGVATLLEVGAYLIPWVDNLLDTVATPAAVVAGALLTSGLLVDVEPWLRWTLGVLAGGGVAGTIQAGTVFVRGGTSVTTGGLGNPVVAGVELIAAVVTTVLAILAPIAAVGLLVTAMGALVLRRERGAAA